MVIYKTIKSHCVKNIKFLPVIYKANESAWMKSIFFEEEIGKWDAELNGRTILILVKNCPAHPNLSNLMNIEMAFFPNYTNSILQPMDQRIIKSLKGHFTKKMLMEFSSSWEEVTTEMIRNCFHHAGFWSSIANAEEEIEQLKRKDDISLTEWIIQFNTSHTFTPDDLSNYVEIDKNLVTIIL